MWNVDYKISCLAKEKTLDESRIKLLFSQPFPATCLFLIASSTQFSNTFLYRVCVEKTEKKIESLSSKAVSKKAFNNLL